MRSVRVGEIHYRVKCSSYGQEGHADHAWLQKSRAAAEDARALYDGMHYRPGCAPWIIEGQATTMWGDPDAAEMCMYAMGKTMEGRLL